MTDPRDSSIKSERRSPPPITDPDGIDTGDEIYHHKARMLNAAIQDIGMGRYQWGLFIVTGFGYFADNAWPIVTGLVLPAVIAEFRFNGPFLKLGQNIGLLVGAAFWGVGADIWGRKISFNLTLLITGLFAFCAAFSPNYVVLTSLASAWSVGVGGNLPVDSSIFLEFVPGTHQYLLTVLSIWWAFGQLIASLIAWPLLSSFSCPPSASSASPPPCPQNLNRGWRYFLLTLSLLSLLQWSIRFFLFPLYESPKYLMGKGDDEGAVDVLRKVGVYNRGGGKRGKGKGGGDGDEKGDVNADGGEEGRKVKLKVEDLQNVGVCTSALKEGEGEKHGPSGPGVSRFRRVMRDKLGIFDTNHVRPLFATRKLAHSTSLLILLWALIGLAFPLYNSFVTYYLATRGADFGDGSTYITYRNQVILSVIGVPGALLAGYMVELPKMGRRGTLSLSTLVTGTFILLSTTARTSPALLGWNCAYSFTSNVMYGVLYALTPELFPTKDRGTGNALCATANRVFGVMAPIIALYANITTSVPIFIAGSIFLVAGLVALALPYESRGRASI